MNNTTKIIGISLILALNMANHTFFAVITFSEINSIAYINHNTTVMISNLQDFYQDNLSCLCLQFYRGDCLNILASDICFHIQVKNQ